MKKLAASFLLALMIVLGLGGLQIATAGGVNEPDGQNNDIDDGCVGGCS